MLSDPLLTTFGDGVAVLTLNRPHRRNALSAESTALLRRRLSDLGQDDTCRAIVLAAAPPAFCSGSDLKELGTMTVPQMCRHEAETARLAREIGLLPQPIIAAVEGYALGGGMILALACDIVVTTRSARWDLPEVRNGWLPPWGLQALMARVGPVKARLLTWAVTEVDGSEAVRLGLADALVDDGAALDEAKRLGSRLAGFPADAVRSTKRYFEPFALNDAERQDAEASRVFGVNAASKASQATLAKFAGRT